MRKGSSKFSENGKLYDILMYEENAMIPMRDEVRLAVDIYRPAINGAPVEKKFPVILQRTPYKKKAKDLSNKVNIV